MCIMVVHSRIKKNKGTHGKFWIYGTLSKAVVSQDELPDSSFVKVKKLNS